MAVQDTTRVAPFGALTVFRAVTNVEGMWNTLIEWNTRRQTAKALNKLTNRELDDIGLTRADIAMIAGKLPARR